jgi:hypothetical protein
MLTSARLEKCNQHYRSYPTAGNGEHGVSRIELHPPGTAGVSQVRSTGKRSQVEVREMFVYSGSGSGSGSGFRPDPHHNDPVQHHIVWDDLQAFVWNAALDGALPFWSFT